MEKMFGNIEFFFGEEFATIETEIIHLNRIFQEFKQLKGRLKQLFDSPMKDNLEFVAISLDKLTKMMKKVSKENREVQELLSVVKRYMEKAEALVAEIEKETGQKQPA